MDLELALKKNTYREILSTLILNAKDILKTELIYIVTSIIYMQIKYLKYKRYTRNKSLYSIYMFNMKIRLSIMSLNSIEEHFWRYRRWS